MMRVIQKVQNKTKKIQNQLIAYRFRGYKEIDGFLSEKEAIALNRFATLVPADGTIVEIGCWKGKSTYCLAQGLKQGKIVVIDSFDAFGDNESSKIYEESKGNKPLIEQFKANMKRFGVLDKILILSGRSHEFVGQIPKIDLLFIDGDHSIEGCKADFINYAPFIASGGYIAFHDFYESRDELGPTWVIKNLVIPQDEFEFIGLFDSLWIGRKH